MSLSARGCLSGSEVLALRRAARRFAEDAGGDVLLRWDSGRSSNRWTVVLPTAEGPSRRDARDARGILKLLGAPKGVARAKDDGTDTQLDLRGWANAIFIYRVELSRWEFDGRSSDGGPRWATLDAAQCAALFATSA